MFKHLVLFLALVLLVFGGCKNPAENHPTLPYIKLDSPAKPP
jgi:hypothetical protein